jgi:hypothetical protein
MKINNIIEQVTHDKKTSEKKNETEIQNTMEGHSSRLEQAEDRISELEDEMVIKGKTEKLLVRQHKTCERNMQELTDSIKRPILQEREKTNNILNPSKSQQISPWKP